MERQRHPGRRSRISLRSCGLQACARRAARARTGKLLLHAALHRAAAGHDPLDEAGHRAAAGATSASISASSPPTTAPTRTPSSRRCSTRRWPSWSPPPSGRTCSYRVIILNSPAINAFALPSGQLYVTRGLIALANDTSELASVLAHEMSHVIASHATMREDEARRVALVTRVFTDLGSDPETGALALAKSKIKLASFSRAQEFEADGIGVGIAARAGYDPYGAARFLTSMGRNADLKTSAERSERSIRARRISSPRIRPRPSASRTRESNARQFTTPGARRTRPRRLSSPASTAWSTARIRAKASCAAAAFCIRKLGFTFAAPEGFVLDNTAQAVLGVKDGGGQALAPRRGAGAGGADARRLSHVGLDREHRAEERRGAHHQRLPGGDRRRQGRPVGVPALCGAVRQRHLSLHLRQQAHERRDRPHLPRVGRELPPHEPGGEPGGQAAAPAGDHRRRPATRSSGWRAAWRSPIARSSASACSTGSPPATGSSRATR